MAVRVKKAWGKHHIFKNKLYSPDKTNVFPQKRNIVIVHQNPDHNNTSAPTTGRQQTWKKF